jgi:hypothetical protein
LHGLIHYRRNITLSLLDTEHIVKSIRLHYAIFNGDRELVAVSSGLR